MWGEKTLLKVISLISPFMAQLLVRNLEDSVVHALRQKAAEEGTSVEEAHRRILRLALLSKKPKKDFKEFLLEMPGGGDDSIFDRHRSQPREVLL
jgi:plasmid stability protein